MVAPRAGFVTGPQEGEREEKVCRALSDPLGGFPVLFGEESIKSSEVLSIEPRTLLRSRGLSISS